MDKPFPASDNQDEIKRVRERMAEKEFREADRILQRYRAGNLINEGPASAMPGRPINKVETPVEIELPPEATYSKMASSAPPDTLIPADSKSEPPGLPPSACNSEITARLAGDEERTRQLTRGTRGMVTAVFIEIAGLTALTRNLPPDRILLLLHLYYEEMIALARDKHGCLITSREGGGINAWLGLPYPGAGAREAVRLAMDAQRNVERISGLLSKQGLPVVAIRVGIETGEAVAGFKVSAGGAGGVHIVGDVAAIARECRKAASGGEIVVGPSAASTISDEFIVKTLDRQVRVIDESGAEKAYEISRIEG